MARLLFLVSDCPAWKVAGARKDRRWFLNTGAGMGGGLKCARKLFLEKTMEIKLTCAYWTHAAWGKLAELYRHLFLSSTWLKGSECFAQFHPPQQILWASKNCHFAFWKTGRIEKLVSWGYLLSLPPTHTHTPIYRDRHWLWEWKSWEQASLLLPHLPSSHHRGLITFSVGNEDILQCLSFAPKTDNIPLSMCVHKPF